MRKALLRLVGLAAMPADIADNGAYTVPALTESKRLNVVFIANNP